MSILILTACILGAVVPIPATALDELRDVALVDQYGHLDSLEAHLGEPTVVMIVTARRLRNLKPWERDLSDLFRHVGFVRIADVPDDTEATRDEVADKLRDRVPDGVAVLIDMERRWATALGLDTSRPNLLLLGVDGELLCAYHGRHDAELAAEVADCFADRLGSS